MKVIALTMLVIVVTVSGCVEPPQRLDPFAGLSKANPAYGELTLGLIFSDNTKNALEYANNYSRSYGTGTEQQVFTDIAAVFQQNFKAVVKIDKVEDAQAVNADLIAVLDIYAKFPKANWIDDAKISVSAIFLTIDHRQVEIVQIESVGTPDLDMDRTTRKALNQTIKELDAALRSSAKLAQFSKSRPAASTMVAAKPQVPENSADTPTSDVDTLPPAKRALRKHAYAVVVGIEQYREKLPKADFAARDATLMGEYLTKVLGYPEENVVVRLNERATRTDLAKYFEEWLRNNIEPGGSVFVYYSGHGAPNTKTGDAYLVPYDGDPSFVETTAYPVKQLYAALDKLPAKDIVVVLDSCFSGAGGRSVLAKGARPMGIALETAVASTGKAMVLAASSGDQISSTYEEKGHGLLTYFFLKGLQGDGDVNKDGVIELAELYEYLKPNVQRIARKQYNTEQTPQLLASPDVLRKGQVRLVERPAP